MAGSAIAGRGDRGAGALLGGIGGALLGNAIASSDRHPGFAYTIRRRDGGLVEIAQADPQPIPVGTRVSVAYGGGRARVSPLGGDGYPPPPASAAACALLGGASLPGGVDLNKVQRSLPFSLGGGRVGDGG